MRCYLFQMALTPLLDWLNKYSNLVIALVTTVYAFFTILLWLATRRQAELTRLIFEATHRPEVSITPTLRYPAHPGSVRIDFIATNHGRVTAVLTEWSASLVHGDRTLATTEPLAGTLAVFADASVDAPSVQVAGEDAALLWRHPPTPAVYLHVALKYRGTSGVQHVTRMSGIIRITGAQGLAMERVEHEIT